MKLTRNAREKMEDRFGYIRRQYMDARTDAARDYYQAQYLGAVLALHCMGIIAEHEADGLMKELAAVKKCALRIVK